MNAVRLDPFAARLLAIRLKSSGRSAHSAVLAPHDNEPALESTGIDPDDALELEAHTMTLASEATSELLLDKTQHAVAPTDCQTCGVHTVAQGETTLQALTNEVVTLKARVQSLEQRLLAVEEDLTPQIRSV
ncbi:MAG: hypothetical protein CMI29_06825 [Opitutae bacterium]|nr:hypothetical protein [Opitutae bacterium]|tara:strand:+ start:1045 stop:1440 length:396 start_codon:yes stop_codon:yes gene_type:complete